MYVKWKISDKMFGTPSNFLKWSDLFFRKIGKNANYQSWAQQGQLGQQGTANWKFFGKKTIIAERRQFEFNSAK